MTTDRFTKVLLSIIAVMLFINFMYAVFEAGTGSVTKGNDDMGRYQITSRAAHAKIYTQ